VTIAELRRRLRAGMASDWVPLGRRIDRLGTRTSAAVRHRLEQAIAASIDKVARRAAGRPAIAYPPELPVSEARDRIAAAIREHQVVIVCGETGSGKTTQIPKICLELGRGTRGLIGHTQPRRSPRASPRASPRSSTPSSAPWSVTRSASPTTRGPTPTSG
jgi:ATP-dependent helicase HrpA